ncbi:MAG: hypothetical protein ACREMC_10590, partial [Gemmatimonadales bacterium]
LTMSATGLVGSPVTFTATGTRDVAAQLLRVSVDTQTGIAGQPVSVLPAVRVADRYGNAVPGASVTFTLTGVLIGSLTPTSPASATTDSAGVARVASWTLATVAGVNTLEAAALGLVGSPMPFSANGITTTATSIAFGPLGGGDGQSGVVGAPLAAAYSVSVLDAAGAPVPGVQVHWAVGAAGGSMNPATSQTDGAGVATSTRTLGTGAGTQTATASVGSLSVTFTATALAGEAAQLVKQSIDPQSGTVATAVTAPVVQVADQFGNAVSGVIVDFVASPGGALGATKDTSDALGLASAGSWTLGSIVGTNTVAVTAGTLPTVTFTATSVAGAPAGLAFLTEPTHGLAGNPIVPAVRVAIQDQYGNLALPAKDVVTLQPGPTSPTGAKVVGASVAASNGVATFPDLAIDLAGAGYTLVATAGNLTGPPTKPFDIGGVIAAVPVDQGPVAAAVNPTTGLVYVPSAASVAVVDGSKPVALPSILGLELPVDAAVNAVTDQIYVSTGGLGAVSVIDGPTQRLRISIPVGTGPQGVAVDDKASRVYVAVATDLGLRGPALVPIDAAKDVVITGEVVPLPAAGKGVALDLVSGRAYVAIPGLNRLAVVDLIGFKVVDTLPVGLSPYGVAVDKGIVYVTNRDEGSVSVIDPAARKEIARVIVGKLPEGIDVDPISGVVYVANAGEPTLSLMETGQFTVFATLQVVPAGAVPKDAAVNRTTRLVYVPTTDNQLRVVRP